MKWIALLLGLALCVVLGVLFVLTTAPIASDADVVRRAPVVTPSAAGEPAQRADRDASSALTVAPDAPREVAAPTDVASPDPTAADEALGAILAGAIVEPDGTVVEATGNLTFIDAAGRSEVDRVTRSYARTGLAPGRWYVRTWGFDGYAPSTGVVAVEPGVALTRHDVVLEPTASFDVIALTPGGEPLTAALPGRPELGVVAHVEAPADELGASLLRVPFEGVARFTEYMAFGAETKPAGTLGTLALEVPLPVYVSVTLRSRVLATRHVTEDVDELRFVIEPDALGALFGDVAVRVVSAEDGAPIAGAQVSLNDAQSGGGSRTTDDDGWFVFEDQRPGDLVLGTSAEGHDFRRDRITVVPDERTEVEIALWPELTLRGTLLADGEARGGSLTYTLLEQGTAGFGVWRYHASVEFDGSFEIGRLGRHAYLLRARVDGFPTALFEVDLRGGEVPPVVLEVSPGVDVVFATRSPWTKPASVSIVGAQGYELARLWRWDGVAPERRSLVPGDYTARIEHADGRVESVAFDVAAGVDEPRVTLP